MWTRHGLNPREAQVLAAVAAGMSNQEIANHLYLSINSIKTYVRTGYSTIGGSSRARGDSRAQAVAWAFENGLSDMGADPD